MGDAAASFNPIYGQGMTVGVKGAVLLRQLLQERLGNRKYTPEDRGTVLKGVEKVPAFSCIAAYNLIGEAVYNCIYLGCCSVI